MGQGGLNLRTAAGQWPTTTTSDWKSGEYIPPPDSNSRPLNEAVLQWPTATVCGNYNRKGASPNSGDGLSTAAMAWMFRSCFHPDQPTRSDGSSSLSDGCGLRVPRAPSDSRNWLDWLKQQAPSDTAKPKLNVLFSERLMGLPLGWTSLEPIDSVQLATVWSRCRQQLPFKSCYTEQDSSMRRTASYEPVVQWVGGKAQLLDTIIPMLPSSFGNYHEPFFGGGALFLELASTGALGRQCQGATYLNDINHKLMNVYDVVARKPEALIAELKVLDRYKDQEWYTAVRELFNTGKDERGQPLSDVWSAALFMYLNRMCFNGLYRVNSKGEFNVNFRKDPNRDIVREEALRKAHAYLRNAHLSSVSFEEALRNVAPGDFVFLDPPYVPISATAKHTSYFGEFGPAEQIRLMEECRRLSRLGAFVMTTNAEHDWVKRAYSGWYMRTAPARRSVNSDPSARGLGVVNDLIITNYTLAL